MRGKKRSYRHNGNKHLRLTDGMEGADEETRTAGSEKGNDVVYATHQKQNPRTHTHCLSSSSLRYIRTWLAAMSDGDIRNLLRRLHHLRVWGWLHARGARLELWRVPLARGLLCMVREQCGGRTGGGGGKSARECSISKFTRCRSRVCCVAVVELWSYGNEGRCGRRHRGRVRIRAGYPLEKPTRRTN
jgi:hypothetical protein